MSSPPFGWFAPPPAPQAHAFTSSPPRHQAARPRACKMTRALPLCLLGVCTALTLPPARVGVKRTTSRARVSIMHAPGDGDASDASDAARTTPPAMKVDAVPADEWDDQLHRMLDQQVLDPWSDTPDECSIDQPGGCIPGACLTRTRHCTATVAPVGRVHRPFTQAARCSCQAI